ncbi:integrase, catalytic region, zinc finger, CCHC-type containing protein [Tanacetum coccineum]
MSQETVHIVANSLDIFDVKKSCVNECNECLELETELFKKKDFIEKEAYDKLVKSYSNLEKHCISLELATQLNQEIFQRENSEKVIAITTLKNELRKLKGKNVVNTTVSKPNGTIAPGMFKLDIEPISPRLKNSRDTHKVYIEKTIEYTDALRDFLESARTQNPSEPLLESACMFTKHVQELLVYVSQTCPSSPKSSRKLVVVTPINKDKRVRFVEPVTSSNNIPKHTDALKTKDYNKTLLPSTRVKPTTSVSGSKPSGNTKNNRITRPPRRNQKNKVEDHLRKVKPSLNKTNSVSEPISNALVKHYVVQIVLWYLDSGCSKHMTGNRSQLMNIVSKFMGTVRFGNDQVAKIMRYGDYQQGNVIISRVYYVEGLRHNLFSVGQYCDADLEVAFRKNTCFVRNLEGVDLLSGSRDTNLYTISLDDMLKTSQICLLSKASKTKSWLWHRHLSHLNFGTLNKLAKDILHEDEAPDAIIKCIKNIQVHLNATVRNVRTDNGTEFVNQTLRDFFENVGISHQTSVARTPQQNGVVKRRNRTLVEAARTMLIFSKAPLFLWAEAINTACYTQNRSLIRLQYNKTPYELMHDKKPNLSFFHVFGSLCYPTNDSEDLGKLNAKVDIGIFVGYVQVKKAFRIYNRRTRKIIETIHVTFDELTAMASEQFDSGPGLQVLTLATSSSGLVPNIIPQQLCNPPKRYDWDTLFQPFFDEYFNPPTITVSTVPVAAAPRAVEIADSPVSTSIDQDAPSSSIPSTQDQEHSPIISQGVEESPKTPLFHDDPLHEPLHED